MILLRALILSFTLLAFMPVAYAEEVKEKIIEVQKEDIETKEEEEEEIIEDNSVRYAPEYCDFEITFPDDPYTSKRCPQNISKCYNITSYTMVYDLTTTVDVSVTCIPSTPENYKRYSERVIKTALNGMVERVGITDYSINTQEREDVHHGALIGTGKYGRQNKIYNAQLWIGQNSIFTVEAKLIGRSHHEADLVFSEILKSIQKKQKPTQKKEEKKK